MDRFKGLARLEWWANKSTCLGSFDVQVFIVIYDSGWQASVAFTSPLTNEADESWAFLM